MPERMMVTCPGCDGVVSVTPTGDEAEVRCLKCDEMVYARNAEGGEWWANVPVADPTVEESTAVPIAAERVDVPEELPDVVQDSVSTPQTESSKAPKETSPPSAIDWLLGAVIASICALLLSGLAYVILEEISPSEFISEIGNRKLTSTANRSLAAFFATAVFMFSVAPCTRWVLQRRGRVSAEEAADLVKDSVKKSSWLRFVALGVPTKTDDDSAVSEMTPPDEESGPPVSLETDTAKHPPAISGIWFSVVIVAVWCAFILLAFFGSGNWFF
jgi:hypothetical protein